MMGISVGGRSMAQWLGSALAATGPDRGKRTASGVSSGGEFRGTMSRRAAEPPSRPSCVFVVVPPKALCLPA